MVELQGLSVSFGPRPALRELSLQVPAGGSLALWGPNGAGKSTTFHAMLGVVPYKGTVRVGGRDGAKDGLAVRKLIGWAPQDLAPADLTVFATVRFMADVRAARLAAVAEFLRPFGLAETAAQPVSALSGGQRKRLSVALATLGDPKVLLLDEPTAGLDPQAREEMLALLQELRMQGKTLMLSTHRWADVLHLADQVAVLDGGELRRIGPPLRVLRPRLSLKGGRRCAGA